MNPNFFHPSLSFCAASDACCVRAPPKEVNRIELKRATRIIWGNIKPSYFLCCIRGQRQTRVVFTGVRRTAEINFITVRCHKISPIAIHEIAPRTHTYIRAHGLQFPMNSKYLLGAKIQLCVYYIGEGTHRKKCNSLLTLIFAPLYRKIL